YTLNITSTWVNPDLTTNSTNSTFIINVLSNPILTVSGNISALIQDNSTALAGNFTVYSIGNDNLTNTTFNVSGLSDFTITFNPTNVSNLGVNSSNVIFVNVSVPFAYAPGNYSGSINVSSVYGGYKTVEINVTVPTRREWIITPESCQRAENPDEGTVCLVDIQNIGNAPINFTINSLSTNHTSSNETNMTVAKNTTYVIEFLYNVTNLPKIFYYENYTINSTNLDSIPTYRLFNATLVPYIEPLFYVNNSTSIMEQNKTIEFYANITDRSTTGINWTRINVTYPNGTSEIFNMTNLWVNNTNSSWYFNFSGDMSSYINWSDNSSVNMSNYTGNTLASGIYNVTITSKDNTGVVGAYYSSFKVYNNLVIGFTTGSTKYYQGSTGSLYYTVTDLMGSGIPYANVTLSIKNPLRNIIYNTNFTTDSTGQILPIPTFVLTNDANTGIYNLTANMTYYDPILETTVFSSENTSFNLLSGSSGGGGGLTADIDTAVVWYPDNIMRFEMWFSYAGNVTEPDNMTLFVY
ncbi:MAG: hypothetical protein KAS12_02405, partial [Candidatus Aenigmarchaeota archaeon]|nr:hypothetical protein [Candidatus Aenigmarchaeota archaeon]